MALDKKLYEEQFKITCSLCNSDDLEVDLYYLQGGGNLDITCNNCKNKIELVDDYSI